MGNRRKWYSILLIGLVILLVSSVVACGECYTQKELDAASQHGWDDGYTEGYDDGLAKGEWNKEEAVKQAHDNGYWTGYWAGYEEAQGEGYDRGHADGKAEGCVESYSKGLEDGKLLGYAEGWAACTGPPYVGSINSDVYHYPWCRYVEQIYPWNKIWFSSSSDARAHDYRPCKVCRPP